MVCAGNTNYASSFSDGRVVLYKGFQNGFKISSLDFQPKDPRRNIIGLSFLQNEEYLMAFSKYKDESNGLKLVRQVSFFCVGNGKDAHYDVQLQQYQTP